MKTKEEITARRIWSETRNHTLCNTWFPPSYLLKENLPSGQPGVHICFVQWTVRYLPRYRVLEENSFSDSILYWVVLTGPNIQPLHIVRNLFIILSHVMNLPECFFYFLCTFFKYFWSLLWGILSVWIISLIYVNLFILWLM